MRATGTCRSCGAPMRWALTETGKRMPLDVNPTDDGNLRVVGWLKKAAANPTPVVAVNPEPDQAVTPYRYTSHFATCPNASQHRRPR